MRRSLIYPLLAPLSEIQFRRGKPKYANAHNNLGALLEDHFSDFNAAKRHYEEAIKTDPKYKDAHNNLAVLLEGHFSDFKGAKLHYEEAIKIDPQFTLAKNNLDNLIKKARRRTIFNQCTKHTMSRTFAGEVDTPEQCWG